MMLKVVIMTLAYVDDDDSVIVMIIKLIIKFVASGVMTIFVECATMMVIVVLMAIRVVVLSAMMGCC
jgi:hypothetical protein